MSKTETENATVDREIRRDPQHIVNMIDQEGWPDALDWLVRNDFGDQKLNELIKKAKALKDELDAYEEQIRIQSEELGVDWYIA